MAKKFWSTLSKQKFIVSLLILLTLSTPVNAANCEIPTNVQHIYYTDRQRTTTSDTLLVSQIPSNIREYATGLTINQGDTIDISFNMEIMIHQGNWTSLEMEPIVRVGSTYITNNCTILDFKNWYSDSLAGTKIRYWGICNYTATATATYIDMSINTGIEQLTQISTTITWEPPCITINSGTQEIINNNDINTEQIINEIANTQADVVDAITNQTELFETIINMLETTEQAPQVDLQITTWNDFFIKENALKNQQAIQGFETWSATVLEDIEQIDTIGNSFRIMWFTISHFLFLDIQNIKMMYIALIFTFAYIGLILKR